MRRIQMTNFKLELCYDGTKYNGWQRLGDTDNTIQNKVETVLSRLLGQPVEVFASGRTDPGVHARRQICSFRAETEMSCEEILAGLRRYLPTDIGAKDLKVAAERFHARYKCVSKTYIYRIWTSEEPNVFERKYLYFYNKKLDLEKMKRAAELLCGEQDFSSFTTAKKSDKSFVREIYSIRFQQKGRELRIEYKGSGFLRNMVRIMTGTLLEVGTGERSAESIREILNARERAAAGFMAPPEGLILWDAEY